MQLVFSEKPDVAPDAVAALRKAVGWDERLDKITRMQGRLYYWAGCLDGDKLVGYVEAISDQVDDAYIRNLMVHPDHQRRGIGLKLLEMLSARVKADGIKMVNVLFEPELASLYRQAGFAIILGGLIDNEAAR
jgi:ribosomal protein S18 acetylase RimI-like enzyme